MHPRRVIPLLFVLAATGAVAATPAATGATGRWTSDSDFLLDVNFISNINQYSVAIRFSGDQIETTINESSGLMRNGKVTGKRI